MKERSYLRWGINLAGLINILERVSVFTTIQHFQITLNIQFWKWIHSVKWKMRAY